MISKLDWIEKEARRSIAERGFAVMSYDVLEADWLNVGMARALARRLGTDSWSRSDADGTFIFGAGAGFKGQLINPRADPPTG